MNAQLFVAEGTFGVLDSGDIPIDTADWSNGLAAPKSHGAIILTGIHTGDVQVTAEPLDTPPPAGDTTTWEEIVETSVHCPSGQLLVESLDLGPADELPNLATAGPVGTACASTHTAAPPTPTAPTPNPSSDTC
ncbi:hypothetical protein ABT052_36880 [Streptomyces sp. NPDC002766]|uniref:hypothetical protein n=1 Tax=Streptomyces sp. NPDC002766 TaxID=3154429 RepID=UPI00333241D7